MKIVIYYSCPYIARNSILVILLLFFYNTHGQNNQDSINLSEDLLQRPEVWRKLKENPDDENLWIIYFSKKSIFDFLEEEYIYYEKWKSTLQSRNRDHVKIAEMKKIERKREQSVKVYFYPEYISWKANLERNFILMDDYFAREYELLNYQYDKYFDIFPDEKYSKEKWIIENEDRLIQLKSKR